MAVAGGSRPGVRAAAVRAWGERARGNPGLLAPSRCKRPEAHIGAGAHPRFPPGVSFSHPRAHPFSGLDSRSESPQGRIPGAAERHKAKLKGSPEASDSTSHR